MNTNNQSQAAKKTKKSGRALAALPGETYSLHNSVLLAWFVHLLRNVANTIKAINSPIILHLLLILVVNAVCFQDSDDALAVKQP